VTREADMSNFRAINMAMGPFLLLHLNILVMIIIANISGHHFQNELLDYEVKAFVLHAIMSVVGV
jgi:hypothetical protein